MKTRPTNFLSGVSQEFGSFRDAVENEIEMKVCFAENRAGFPPDYQTVEEILRRKLNDSLPTRFGDIRASCNVT